MRTQLAVLCGVFFLSCSRPAENATSKPTEAPANAPKITQFYSDPTVLRGASSPANICYGVEGATEVTLDPPVERLWPAVTRCFAVTPTQNTTYTITARNAKGQTATQKTMVQVGPPTAKIVEVSVDALEIQKGQSFPFCVRAVNVTKWELSAGKWTKDPDSRGGCAVDNPQSSTTYTIKAIGALGEVDTERVSVTVR